MIVLLYDAECGLCDGTVRFLLKRDHAGALHYAALGSPYAERELSARGVNSAESDTVYVLTPDGAAWCRSTAVLHALDALGGPWRWVARAARCVPAPLRDALYRFVARNRIRWFGSPKACVAPTPEQRARFIRD